MLDQRTVGAIESPATTRRLAVLIDADNAQATVIDALLTEVARFGEATVKRIYGDFTESRSKQWKQVLNRYAISPIQQFAYTTGKNATDSRLIIDAMDLLHKGNLDGFCLVSSDSDFTGLAGRIREEGLMVYGFGEHKTPEAFRNACHQFLFTENLRPVTEIKQTKKALSKKTATLPKKAASPVKGKTIPYALIKKAIENASDDTGWANLGALGNYLIKLQPDFDSRTFGYKKLKDLFVACTKYFELKETGKVDSPSKSVYVRIREAE